MIANDHVTGSKNAVIWHKHCAWYGPNWLVLPDLKSRTRNRFDKHDMLWDYSALMQLCMSTSWMICTWLVNFPALRSAASALISASFLRELRACNHKKPQLVNKVNDANIVDWIMQITCPTVSSHVARESRWDDTTETRSRVNSTVHRWIYVKLWLSGLVIWTELKFGAGILSKLESNLTAAGLIRSVQAPQ